MVSVSAASVEAENKLHTYIHLYVCSAACVYIIIYVHTKPQILSS